MLIAIVVVYRVGTLVAGALLSTRIKRVSDYLVAGRSLGLAGDEGNGHQADQQCQQHAGGHGAERRRMRHGRAL